ncbi:hypothetical protein LTR37_002589 [Vermiconidia calcicola]|uniref:Uncharacterized protein n=1 Tax=Vermiconidia calcicola TaxID=1690605 RepID=A0ACC3NSH4_9PEZI|nr:hypothetical protein LTR37_002589 [Vermiconidia calcicola]
MSNPNLDPVEQVRSWGFKHAFTYSDSPNNYYPPHTHSGVTTHLVLKGELEVRYPDDKEPKKEKVGAGERFDVEANRSHEVWVGEQGCTMVIGE